MALTEDLRQHVVGNWRSAGSHESWQLSMVFGLDTDRCCNHAAYGSLLCHGVSVLRLIWNLRKYCSLFFCVQRCQQRYERSSSTLILCRMISFIQRAIQVIAMERVWLSLWEHHCSLWPAQLAWLTVSHIDSCDRDARVVRQGCRDLPEMMGWSRVAFLPNPQPRAA